MFIGPQVRELQLRRQELLAESQINRHTLILEWQHLKTSLAWARTSFEVVKSLQPLWVLLAPVAGLVAARKWRSVQGWWHRGTLVWRIASRFLAAWRLLR